MQQRIVLTALACGAAITVAKFSALAATGSSTLLTEAVHALIATSSQALLLHGLRRGGRGELYFWSFVAPIPLYAMGAGVAIWEGVDKLARTALVKSAEVVAPDVEGWVLAAALLLTTLAITYVRRQEPRAGEPARFAVVLELAAAIAGVLVALAGLAARHLGGFDQASGGASIGIGLILALVAAVFAIETRRVLNGAGPAVATGAAPTGDARTAIGGAPGAAEASPPPAADPKPKLVVKPAGPTGRGKKGPPNRAR